MSKDSRTFLGRLPSILGILGAVVYTAGFSFFAYFWFAATKFDAIFFIGLLGLPGSLLANVISDRLAMWIFGDQNIPLELSFLFLFGVGQYFLIGFLVGKLFVRLFRKN